MGPLIQTRITANPLRVETRNKISGIKGGHHGNQSDKRREKCILYHTVFFQCSLQTVFHFELQTKIKWLGFNIFVHMLIIYI